MPSEDERDLVSQARYKTWLGEELWVVSWTCESIRSLSKVSRKERVEMAAADGAGASRASGSAGTRSSIEDSSEATEARGTAAETSGRSSESMKGRQSLQDSEAEPGLKEPLLRTDIEAGGLGPEETGSEGLPDLRSLSKGSSRSSTDSVDECRICKEEREPGEKMIR
jgi:hypothetical protein